MSEHATTGLAHFVRTQGVDTGRLPYAVEVLRSCLNTTYDGEKAHGVSLTSQQRSERVVGNARCRVRMMRA
eukprot:737512-Pleurochrysis_carterae.AAC.1